MGMKEGGVGVGGFALIEIGMTSRDTDIVYGSQFRSVMFAS